MQTLRELLKLPKAHIGRFLATILPIYRQRRKINGKRYTNASLKLKVEAWQRVIREIWQQEYNELSLTNAFADPKTFNLYSDPELQVLVQVLNKEMQVSARGGLTLGVKKRARSLVTPADLKAILLLWDLKNPVDVEHVFEITVMMNTGTRGGEELRKMNWGQFERQYSEQVGFYYTFSPMEQGTFKNNKGGLKDFKKVRKKVQIFDNKNVMDCFNPYKVILGYESLLPKGWSDSIEARPLFLKPLRIINNGVGFQPIPRGHNVTGKFLERAMNRIGKVGTFCNTQTRASFINGAMETGMRDNEIKAVTGQRSGVTLNSYKDPSLAFKKASSERMLGSLGVGGSTWHAGLA